MRRELVNTKVHIGIYEGFAPNLDYGTLLTYTTHNFDGYIIDKTSNFCGLVVFFPKYSLISYNFKQKLHI